MFVLHAFIANIVNPLIAATTSTVDPTTYGQKAGRAIGLGAGAGGGAAGAGAGIGMLFGKVIESVTRQPEMRDEITSIQWLGFALTEACFFYGLVGGFIAFFL
jgi:F-type H+-transporting ATPase subunit c